MRYARAVVVVLLALGACAPTDTGNPPLQPTVNQAQLEATIMPGVIVTTFTLSAPAGTVDPPEGELLVLDLEMDTPPYRIPVQPDGSFASDPLEGERMRLWVEGTEARSAPFDFVVTEDGIAAAPEGLSECVRFEPAFSVDFGALPVGSTGAQRLTVHNDCAASLGVTSPSPLGAEGIFSVETVTPGDVPEGGTAVVRFLATPAASGPHVGSAFIEITGANAGRRPITLFLSAR